MAKNNTETQKLRAFIKKTINEGMDQWVRNGHWREDSKSQNIVTQLAYKRGWEVDKADGNEAVIEGAYNARLMVGVFGFTQTDAHDENWEHPKDSWPMLIANLNKALNQQGYAAKAANYHVESEGEIRIPCGTIIVQKGKSLGAITESQLRNIVRSTISESLHELTSKTKGYRTK